MDMLKKYWPLSFKVSEKDVASLIIQIVILALICIVVGFLISIVALIPIVGILAGLVGALVELYVLVGIVLCVLKFLGIVK